MVSEQQKELPYALFSAEEKFINFYCITNSCNIYLYNILDELMTNHTSIAFVQLKLVLQIKTERMQILLSVTSLLRTCLFVSVAISVLYFITDLKITSLTNGITNIS